MNKLLKDSQLRHRFDLLGNPIKSEQQLCFLTLQKAVYA